MNRRFVQFITVCTITSLASANEGPDVSSRDLVVLAERARIETILRVSPAVVCVYDEGQHGGGSGVMIDPEGYGLTNFHVVAGMLDTRRGYGGMSDGKLYDLAVLGVDPTGDVAMFRLQGDVPFPFAPLGDSDEMKVGDGAIAMGNPFVLSEDYTPSVSFGIVTGIHRYQWGEGGNLVYSDCIQVDTPINPGNSGGPLFNLKGEVVGINGRISVSKRGRFNVGLGYAITSIQISRFVPGLRAGLLVQHGTLQATVGQAPEGLVFGAVRPKASADRAGIKTGDVLVELDHKIVRTPNEFASMLGTYPDDWSLPLKVKRDGTELDVVARLDAIPVKQEKSFTVDESVNREAVKHVIRRFQHAVFTDRLKGLPSSYEWTARQEVKQEKGEPQKPTRVSYVQEKDGPIRAHVSREGSTAGRDVEFDAAKAVEHTGGDATSSFALPPEEAMVLHTRFIQQKYLLSPVDLLDLGEVKHAGGRLWISNQAGNARRTDNRESAAARGRLVETIEWPIAGFAKAKFNFDAGDGLLISAEVTDLPTGNTVTLEFEDYRDIGGLRWPIGLVIRDRDKVMRESTSDWGLTP